VLLGVRWIASIAAQRTSRLPCLVIGPRWVVVSDSRCRGVSPAQQVSCRGAGEAVHVADLGHYAELSVMPMSV
jgi:hypothetical protein